MPPLKQQDYLQQCIEEAKQRKENAAQLAELFSLNFTECPDERQFNIWLRRYSRSIIADAIERAAEWVDDNIQIAETNGEEFEVDLDRILRYATGVMIRKTAEAKRG